MEIQVVFAGALRRDYILPYSGRPLLDVPGGGPLHAAVGAATWRQLLEDQVGLLARVGEDYPREWLRSFEKLGFNVEGIHILPGHLDLRCFHAFLESGAIQRTNPVAHFARLGLPYPKSLLGYQPPVERTQPHAPAADAPHPSDLPDSYLQAHGAHVCPLDHLTSSRLITAFRQAGVQTITLDPSPAWMMPAMLDEIRLLLRGLTVFLPAEEELRAIFWGRSDDLWEMLEEVAGFGCEFIVVKCASRGQILYDSVARKRWQVPAYPARRVDPIGAGDSFCGGFLAEYVRDHDPLRAVLVGNISASLAIEGSGAFHALDALPGLAQARLDSLAALVRQV